MQLIEALAASLLGFVLLGVSCLILFWLRHTGDSYLALRLLLFWLGLGGWALAQCVTIWIIAGDKPLFLNRR